MLRKAMWTGLYAGPGAARASGPSPWAVLGGALAGGYALAKAIDWRGHAHPRG